MKNHVSPWPSDELSQIGFLLGRAYYSSMGFLEHLLDETGMGDPMKPGVGSLLFALFREDDRTILPLAAFHTVARPNGRNSFTPALEPGNSFRPGRKVVVRHDSSG